MADFDLIKIKSIIEPAQAEKNDIDQSIELSLQQMPHGPRCKTHSIILLVITICLCIWFAVAIFYYVITHHDVGNIGYIICELLLNLAMLFFTIYIWIIYIRIPLFQKQGAMESGDCTSFDVYSVFSYLWFLTTALLTLANADAAYGLFLFLRMIAIIAPGYIHKTYIRLTLHPEYTANNAIYLGDIKAYKVCCILFLFLQLFSNVVQLPLNATFFQDSITEIFHLEDGTDAFHFSFIIACVFGRPFVSILNFHLLMLYLTWLVNGDKPQTHHNLDLFTFSLHESQLNTLFGVAVMALYVIDMIFTKHRWYRAFMLFAYIFFALYHFYFLIHEGRKTRRRMTQMRQEKKNIKGAEIDICTLFESSFVLIGGALACVLYLVKIEDFEYKFNAFAELVGWCVFMVSQYIFILFIQMDYVFGRKLLVRPTTQKMLSFSQMISAASVIFLFSFEYFHFVHILMHHEENEEEDTSITMAYALFWCLIEYFIWSFVAINQMLHHIHEMKHVDQERKHFTQSVNRRMTQLLHDRKDTKQAFKLKVQTDEKWDYTHTMNEAIIKRHRTPTYLFVSPSARRKGTAFNRQSANDSV